ncbi:hypothetical protein TNCV_2323921 [Trichonephila clavipes]|nr:hypothetical protein TNCV_2323921 [Trichonephila clavipes]
MGTPTARNVAPAGSEYAETVRSNHCNSYFSIRACHIHERLGLEWWQGEKYETKHMVANPAPMAHLKSGFPIWIISFNYFLFPDLVTKRLSCNRKAKTLMYPGLIFQQDKARPHTARAAMNRLAASQTLP